MTYRFKLSSRLSLLRSSTLAMALFGVACVDGDMSSLTPFDALGRGTGPVAANSTVSPYSATIKRNMEVQFSARAGGTWVASGGQMTTDGRFTAKEPGTYRIVRESGGRPDTAKVTVLPATPDQEVAVSPVSVQILTGGQAHFAATVTSRGNARASNVKWSATGGTIDEAGNYTAGNTPGTYAIIGSTPDGADTSTVVVTQATIRHIVQLIVAPMAATVVAGGVQQYSASARYDDGFTESVAATFSSSGVGTVSSSGAFSAGATPGSYQITASGPDGGQATVPGSVVSQTQAAQSSSATGAHEPVGFQPIYKLNPGAPASPLTGANYGYALQTNLKVVDGKYRVVFPAGLEQGTSSISPFDMVERLYPATTPSYGSWYLRMKVTLVGTDWISQNVITKMVYLMYGTRTQNNTGVLGIKGPQNGSNNDPQQAFVPIVVLSRDLTGGSITLSPNVPGQVGVKSLTVGVEHTIELKGVMGTPDRFDGEIHMWVDGVEVMNYSPTSPYPYPECYPSNPWQQPLCQSRVMLRATSDGNFTEGFYGVHFDPVWGGGMATPAYRTRNDYLDISEVYVSVPK